MSKKSQHSDKSVDIVFFYRSLKKKRYFTLLSSNALSNKTCNVLCYHKLGKQSETQVPGQELTFILDKLYKEYFHARDHFIVTCIKSILQPLFKQQIKKIYRQLYEYLQNKKPKLIAIWNGSKFQDYILHSVNKSFNIPIVYFENGIVPSSTTLDFQGINANNSLSRKLADYQTEDTSIQFPPKIIGREYKQTTASKQALPKRYLLIPFQMDRDTQILDNSPWIKSMVDLFEHTYQALSQCQQDDLHIVYRPHPSTRSKYKKLQTIASKHSRLHFDSSTPLQLAIEQAEAVITINSSVGMEALLLNKKVIVLGEAFYKINDLTLSAESTIELQQKINELSEFTPNLNLRNQFYNYINKHYVIKGNWRTPNDEHYKSIKDKLLTHPALKN